MKYSTRSRHFRPFDNLDELLKKNAIKPKPFEPVKPKVYKSKNISQPEPDPENDIQLFKQAMADVIPMPKDKRIHTFAQKPQIDIPRDNKDNEVVEQLEALIKNGTGFVVSQTPEYVEGTGYKTHPEITRRLHKGDFSIQADIDLHGLVVEAAKGTVDAFLSEAISTGKRAVLIIHGRGLRSPAKPVLKTKVLEWLTRGTWRKWVIAYTSARNCDGGAGATYVLLRKRPVTKKFRKKD